MKLVISPWFMPQCSRSPDADLGATRSRRNVIDSGAFWAHAVACRACTSTSGCMCTKTPLPCARQRFRMSLAALRLYHGRWSGDAVPEGAAVAGSDPPLSMPGTASGRVGCARPSTLRREVAPVQQSRAGRPSVTWDGRVPDLAAWAVARAIGGTPALLGDARLPGRPAGRRTGDPPPRSGAQTAFPRRD